MANFCLLPEKVDEFKKALKKKEITIPQLLNMTSEDRITLLREYAGDNAPQVNTMFEEKLVLKNRMLGIKNWASKLGEIGKYSPEGKAKLQKAVSEYRAKQQERVFSPKENEQFLASLAEKQIGTEITEEEAKNIFDLAGKTDKLRAKFDEKTGKWDSETDRLNYGASKVQYENYVSVLKGEGEPFKEIVKGRTQEFKTTVEDSGTAKAVYDLGVDALSAISNNAISIVASVDNSFLGRQGLKVLLTRPTKWWPAAKQSFVDIYNVLGGKDAMNGLMADVYSRPNFLNGNYKKADIVAKSEEQFPTSLPEQIPGLGRVFKASEVAFKGSALRMRMDLFDFLHDMAKNNGVKINDIQIKDIGAVVNSLTARGKWGKYGESPLVKLILWAPRMLKGNLDILTAHGVGSGLKTPFARKEAWKNLAKIVGGLAVLLLIVKAIKKDSVDFDPTSSDFGSIVVDDTKMSRAVGALTDFAGASSTSSGGRTKFDVTGGLGSIVTFISREITGKTKSPTTGIKTDLGSGFGDTSRFDAFINFLTGKTTPLSKTAIDLLKGKNSRGQTPNLGNVSQNLLLPISVQNILGIFQDPASTDWNQNPSAELKQFKDKVGEDTFKEANDQFNQQYTQWQRGALKDESYLDLSDEDKTKAVAKKKDQIKSSIFKQYNFKYKK